LVLAITILAQFPRLLDNRGNFILQFGQKCLNLLVWKEKDMADQEPRSDEEIRKLIGEEGPSWRRKTDIRVFYFFIYSACVAALLGAISASLLFHFTLLGFLTIAVFLGLAFGVHKKNQICAIALFVYGILWTIFGLTKNGNFPIGFLTAFLLGIIGTFAINKRKTKRST
jgi:hypothetical protein